MAVNILLRRGTAAEWTASNPTLLEGEVGVETDTKKLKVGDGLTVWASLPYINLTPAAAASIYATSANPTFTGTVNGITKSMVGLGNVDNTSDENKPVSTAQQTALGLKAPLANPTFTGTVSLDTGVSLVFEGATADAFETTLVATDPTADRTLTLPNSTGTIATQEYVTNELGTHSADTTSVHGIGDTSVLATMTYADTAVSTHSSDTTSVHGIADTADLATKSYADTAISTHNSDTTSVHGITDTAELATKTYADNAAANAVSTSIGTHEADTVNVHGIADTSILVTTTGTQTLTNKTLTSPKINENVAVTATSTELNILDGVTSSTAELNILDGVTSSTAELNILAGATLSTTELNYVDGVTSAIQTQINDKAPLASPTFTGTVSGVTKSHVGLGSVDNTADADKPVSTATQTALDLKAPKADPTFTGTVVLPSTTSVGDVSATELGYVNGVTSAIQTQLDDKLSKTGGTMTGAITLSGAPTSDLHAATKLYVDNVTAGLNFHEAVHAASVNNLAVIYNNGTSGVGATLTADTNRAFSTIDSESVVLGERVLIKNQTDAKQNGIYTLTTAGSVSVPWVLTRATDADNNPTGEMKNGDFTFVQRGTVNASIGYINNSATNPIVIGTDNITYTEFNAAKTIVAGDGLTEATPGVISVATDGITSAMILDGTIVDGDINASAAIAQSKISGLTAALGDKAPLASPTFTGTVTLPAAGIVFSDGTQALEGVPSRTPIIQKTASYTLSALTERDDLIEMSSASAVTLTIPTDATLDFPIGTSLDVLQTSTGQVTIAGAGGVTVNATPGLKLRTTWSSATLFKRAANTWVVFGDLTA
jgi:hypothetical protein